MKLVFVVFVLITVCFHAVQCTHLRGSFKSNEFFRFLIKFGFQKTDRHQRKLTHGYIFGNVTSRHQPQVPITLAVLDRSYFLEFYKNRLIYDKKEACKHMFVKLKHKAFDKHCAKLGNDYLRKIPCPKGALCVDEDAPQNVINGHQFTYVIQDLLQPS